MNQHLCAALWALVGAGALAAQSEKVGNASYTKLATRAETEAAVLAALRPNREQWGEWWQLGPFPYAGHGQGDLARFRDPEAELPRMRANEAGPDLARSYAGKGGLEARWRSLGAMTDKRIDLKIYGEPNDELATAFLYTTITSPSAHSLSVDMGSDDGLRLWLNGELLLDKDVPRGLDPYADHLSLSLKAGVNHLLAEVAQGYGGWDYQLSTAAPLSNREDAELNYYLDRDFPPTRERAHWRALTIPVPDEIVLEVGGIDFFADASPVVCTRRGELYWVENAYAQPAGGARFHLFASGLHEPLGLAVRRERGADGAERENVYCVQRGELTRLVDLDGDRRADRYECVSDGWGISGNYHEFAFGPKFAADGSAWITLNVGFCGGLGKSIVPWRGWALLLHPDGVLEPICDGLRSPNGIGQWSDGEWFYLDNQGDYVATNRLSHLHKGAWQGHPASLRWRSDLASPQDRPPREPAAIFLPYKKMGQSVADLALDRTQGRFGPFSGQFFTGDQTLATVERLDLELVDGQYQGACFPFAGALDCGVNRVAFAPDGSLFVGQTDRGWGSVGRKRQGLQRIVYTGQPPFEILHLRARPTGFELELSEDVDPASAADPRSYRLTSFTYEYHAAYGAPEDDTRELSLRSARLVAPRRVELAVEPLRAGYVHELHADGLRSARGAPLLHPEAWYTLQRIPGAPDAAAGAREPARGDAHGQR